MVWARAAANPVTVPDEAGVKSTQGTQSPDRLESHHPGGHRATCRDSGYSDLSLQPAEHEDGCWLTLPIRLPAPVSCRIPQAAAAAPAAGPLPERGDPPLLWPVRKLVAGQQRPARDRSAVVGDWWPTISTKARSSGGFRWEPLLALRPRGSRTRAASVRTRNGPVVTAGGLDLHGDGSRPHVRAYDKDTGKTLWEKELESNPQSIPAVYEVGGRQYVAFFCSSGRWEE